MAEYRLECDSIGERRVPRGAYYGIQSMRGRENFPISGRCVHPELIRATVEIKKAAALANKEAGALSAEIADAMVSACEDILAGRLPGECFIVDAVQGGAGTSLNMNANEVVANRAIELLGGEPGDYSIVHPNDHANCAQSTNDVVPSAGKIALIRLLGVAEGRLASLCDALRRKAEEFSDIIKMGRTEMQDAVPISFGQTFSAYASMIERDVLRFKSAAHSLSEVNMGGTAIGTGINAERAYIDRIVPILSEVTGLELKQAPDLVDSTQNLDCFAHVSGIVKTSAVSLSKLANDLRLMSSGPRTGFGEINLPARQNGSSIMPGKVNPVVPEVINQIAFRIIGNDATVTMAAEAGQLELNAFEPIIFYSLFESLDMLSAGLTVLTENCINGITVNRQSCEDEVERSIGIVTAVCPYVGYAKAASVAKRALAERRSVRDILIEEKLVSPEELDRILDPHGMI